MGVAGGWWGGARGFLPAEMPRADAVGCSASALRLRARAPSVARRLPLASASHPLPTRCAHHHQVVLFEEEGFRCQSRYGNQIAFAVDCALLLKVLRAAAGHDADALEMKLAMRSLPCAAGAPGMCRGGGGGRAGQAQQGRRLLHGCRTAAAAGMAADCGSPPAWTLSTAPHRLPAHSGAAGAAAAHAGVFVARPQRDDGSGAAH